MSIVLDNLDLVARAFGHTFLLFLVSGVLSLFFGTVLAAMRVGPVAVMSRGTAYVAIVRNTPLLIVLLFFRFAAPKIGITFDVIDVTYAGISSTTCSPPASSP